MPIRRDDIIRRLKGEESTSTSSSGHTVEEDLEFLQKRVNELVERLEIMEEDIERVTFVVALFAKYMQYYATKNNFMIDKDVIRTAVLSADTELQEAYDEHGITDYEQELIVSYLEKIQHKMYELSDEEKKKWK